MRAILTNERGSVLAMVALGTVVICGMAGLAIDEARRHATRAELSRAVDAAALSGAAALRRGESEAEQRIRSLAAANGIIPTLDPNTTLAIEFGRNEEGENTVQVSATRRIPTFFRRVMGHDHLDVASVAEATAPSLDLVLVLDRSGSMEHDDAWDDLQIAAKDFVDRFDDDIDLVGLVSHTDIAEGLQLAKRQLDVAPVRDRSVKVVVLCSEWTGPEAVQMSQNWTAQRANEIRAGEVYLVVIALGMPGAPIQVPDHDFMKRLANVDGNTDPSQLQGAYYFAPSVADLGDVLEGVAEDILVRLTQ